VQLPVVTVVSPLQLTARPEPPSHECRYERRKFGAHYTFRFENGKIVERWSTIDRLPVLMQIGAVSLPSKK
jgi:hypothetical protein